MSATFDAVENHDHTNIAYRVDRSPEGGAIVADYKVKFLSKIFAPDNVPGFPYVLTSIERSGLVYTAIIPAVCTVINAEQAVMANFPDAEVDKVTVAVEGFTDQDIFHNSPIRGAIRETKRGFFQSIWYCFGGR
jgi:hypothetical protein